ncbi:MAG TPA: HAMP domain-containing sensor histidine kinase, partial [Nitrososphaeraceae archaeon]|nr:HAMP domain-containing sensor histidine kinase [Nitrososphaeraceae archaeon]
MFERIRSKILLKIGVLIAIETMFIISSFGVLAYFQSEDSSLGNSINIAGKNRYLTATALYEAEKYLDSQSPTDLSELNLAIDNLESNILVLKQGGKTSGIEVKPLSPEFSGLWNIINEKGQSFKRFINENIIGSTNQPRLEPGQKQSIRTELGSMALSLVSSSDTFVTNLGQTTERNSQNLLLLEVALAIVSGIILMFILYLVLKILRPIFSLITATSEAKKGNLTVSVRPKGNDELSALSESFNSMILSIREHVKKQNLMQNEIQKANEELKNKNRLMDEFINIAAHELRTPIQPILGLADHVRSKVNGEEQEYMEIIVRNARRLQRLTQNILDVTKIENHSLNLDRESFDLNDMISKLVVEYTSRIKRTENEKGEGKDVKLIHLRNKEIIVVNADRERLNQVISNLLSNAMKFTKEGTISISEQKRIESKDGVQEEEVIVMVNDTGSGIDKEIMAKLFSKFTTKSQQGTGLGLYISKSIV